MLDAGSNLHVTIRLPSTDLRKLGEPLEPALVKLGWTSKWAGSRFRYRHELRILCRVSTTVQYQRTDNLSRSTLAGREDWTTWGFLGNHVIQKRPRISKKGLQCPPNGSEPKYSCKEFFQYQTWICTRDHSVWKAHEASRISSQWRVNTFSWASPPRGRNPRPWCFQADGANSGIRSPSFPCCW